MDTLGDLTMNELIELANVAQHKRRLHSEAMKRYQTKNIDKFREIWRDQKRKKRLEKKEALDKETICV